MSDIPTTQPGAADALQAWVNCPICGGCDMRQERDPHEPDLKQITCTNLACASNGGDNADAFIHSRDAEVAELKEDAQAYANAAKVQREAKEEARTQVATLTEALEPFARVAALGNVGNRSTSPEEVVLWQRTSTGEEPTRITLADCIAALAALAEVRNGEAG